MATAFSVAAAASASVAPACSSTPFRSSPAKHRWYRIPAVVTTPSGTLVAFAERRDRVLGDLGDFEIVTTRSADRGCHWSAVTVIGDDAANRVSNPVPIVDAVTGDVLLFSVVAVRPGGGGTRKGLYLQTSRDDGRTFSPLPATALRPAGQYRGGLTGVGHGLQLAVGHPGRLILPMGYRTSTGAYGAYGVYSDDHGATWHTGYDQQDPSGTLKLIEGTIAELPSGDLLVSYRDRRDGARAGTARRFAVSKDGGESLTGLFRSRPLPIVSVQGSALALTGPHRGQLLFSAPADPTATLRRDMSVFVSTTGGATWRRKYQVELESTPGSYSDLVQLDASTVGVLYETGTRTWKERIAFEPIAISRLTRPTKVAATVSHQRSARPTRTSARAKVMVTVRVKGISSPPGRVTLTATAKGRTRSASVQLTYSNRGVRAVTLPKLAKGSYRLSVTYSGTGRIAGATRPAGTLRVVTG